MIDIVFPQGNESKFAEIARKLGYDSLYFVYPIENFNKNQISFNGIDTKKAIICEEKNIIKARKLTKYVFVKSPEDPRHLIENNRDIIIFDFEKNTRKDKFHQKSSGLNHILCDLAAKHNITIAHSLNSLINLEPRFKDIILGRVIANIRLCKKYKNKTLIGSFAKEPFEMRGYKDLISVFNNG
jgi:RNase P/RNase MRP subunit p30